MKINKEVTSYIKKILPSQVRKAETVIEEYKPLTERIDPNKFIGNYYIQAFSASGSNKVLNKIVSTRNILGEIKDLNTKETFEKLYERIINETTNIENLSDGITTLIQKVEMVENPEIKKEILSGIKEVTGFSKKGFKSSFKHEMSFIEELTDTVNIMNGRYMNVDSKPRQLYKWLDNKNSWFTDVIDGKKGTEETYRNGYAQAKKRTKSYEKYVEDFDKLQSKNVPETYQNNLKHEAFRDFINMYNKTRPEIVNKIYNTEYLKTVDPELRKIYQDIHKEYGTKILSSNANMTVNDAKYLQEELRLWKEAGNGRETLPDIIDVNYLDKYLNQGNFSGTAFAYDKTVTVRELLEEDAAGCVSTLRHEINHINDHIEWQPIDDFTKLYRLIKWRARKLFQGKKWKKELENAGITNEGLRNYALKNRKELKSVTTETNMKILSENYKDTLVNVFGMQRWIFNIPKNEILIKEHL